MTSCVRPIYLSYFGIIGMKALIDKKSEQDSINAE